ncbi:S8 family serine peptidase (plasmid) [Paenibacillus cellulosilyticus]|nr:S8 family serine peptidase [Paenibacillus cellulosilyticus]
MDRHRTLRCAVGLMLAGLLLWAAAADSFALDGQSYASASASAAIAGDYIGEADQCGAVDETGAESWLLKWRDTPPDVVPAGTRVISRQTEMATDIVVPEGGGDGSIAQWLTELRADDRVAYVQPNDRVHVLSSAQTHVEANDPYLSRQTYLDLIGAKKAWNTVHDQTDITIALVDTGVDFSHPDLKGSLLGGVNLLDPKLPPQDDNGHGTNVAGVLAATGNNKAGIAGILWRARIMPIKALDEDGAGDESKLGEGILYAVNKGAAIVVLSVGLYRFSTYMRDIVQYAESKGVLLVAATGNDGEQLGSKVAIEYPAAYPTVLAVGGVKPNGQPEPRSNSGPEIDIAAPWNVFTTALGGGYKEEEGTSMAAPQAAAAAALVLRVHPNFKPYEVRELLRQTAKDIGQPGVDEETGYGLLQVDKAVTAQLRPDAYEPNDSRDRAAKWPLQTRIAARLTGGLDQDWYRVDVPYDGKLTIQLQGLNPAGTAMPPVRMMLYSGKQAANSQDAKLGNTSVEWPVKKGTNWIKLQLYDHDRDDKLPYLLTSDFHMNPDAYESNDKSYAAATLQPRSQVITGNFDKQGDRDWYVVNFKRSGTLKLLLQTDTVRIDPSLAVQREGQKLVTYDDNGDGEQEQTPLITVTPGRYYIRVYNAAAADASPVTGLYTLKLDISTKYDDPNEPNDKSYTATAMRQGTEYLGVIGTAADEDWFQLRLTGESYASIDLSGIPADRKMTITVYDKRQKVVGTIRSVAGRQRVFAGMPLQEGLYYFKITTDAAFNQQYYHFTVRTESLKSGYRDIDGHWAEAAITALSKEGIVSGYADYKFEPDRAVTRAEGAALLVRAFAPKSNPARLSFKDLSARHWAYNVIALAVSAGYMTGYPDRTFGPDRPMTRAEMAVMLGHAAGVQPAVVNGAPYADVAAGNWASPMLTAMRAKGWISGYPGNRFLPGQFASRAEFTSMLFRIRNSI